MLELYMFIRRKIHKTLVVAGIVLLLSVSYTLIYGYFDKAFAPFEDFAYSAPQENIDTDPQDAQSGQDTPTTTQQTTTPTITYHNDYIAVRMSPSDVHKGSLLLINNDHFYEIPHERDFISITDEKTQTYRVTGLELMLDKSVIIPLNTMMDAYYEETGQNTVAVISAFRDYERQMEILNEYTALLGRSEALRWAAIPGHSEHHTGLAIDFGLYSGGTLRTFLGTGQTSWFRQNSYKFGFILRFTHEKSEITQTAHEPWHFRYVGIPHSHFIHQNGWCLEEYIELIMEHDRETPFIRIVDGKIYEVYHTLSTEIHIPFDCEFDISGNNIDGFIVTIKRY